ncbi:myosin-like coiled-coil protein-domain-containing protein [Geopyxis carbonaria]|nr:myosin-like coiled-coil protein-domain-containing protein [Geopyxis carbonaria]
MAALVDPASVQRNGNSKSFGENGTSGGLNGENGENIESGISESISLNSAPPLTAIKKSINTNSHKGTKKLDPSEVNNLLHQKISQLETDASMEEEEEKAISRAVRKANKELAELVSSREDHLAKVDAIQTKYSELLHDMKRLERDHAKSRKRADQLQKEKDQSRTDMQKAITMKHKLETLCRELQKENKRIKDESKKLAYNEQQKREELSEKFESTIWEIKSRMEEEDDCDSHKLNIDADELFKSKFKSFVDQYEMRELHFQSLLRTKELEVQWNLARYEQQRKFAESEGHRAKGLLSQKFKQVGIWCQFWLIHEFKIVTSISIG